MGGAIIAIIQLVSHTLYPVPEGLDLADELAMEKHIASLPIGAFLMVLLSYALGALAAGFTSAKLSKPHGRVPALICGVVLTILGLINLLMIPHPIWFWLAALSVFIPFSYLGFILTRKN